MYKLYIVEDDSGIAAGIKTLAENWEFEVRICSDFRKVTEEFTEFAPHIVLMDIGLPFFNGYHWCAELRKLSNVPVIFLSSAADNMNIVMAVNMGADDFIAKPFDGSVLMAKIQALLRRSYDFAATAPVLSHRGAFLSTGENTLTVNVNRLRKKLAAAGLEDFITTKFGMGYTVL